MIKNSKNRWVPEIEEIKAASDAARIKMELEMTNPINGTMNEAERNLHWFHSGFNAALRYTENKKENQKGEG